MCENVGWPLWAGPRLAFCLGMTKEQAVFIRFAADVDRASFWEATRKLEQWHPHPIRYTRYDVIEEGNGWQDQAQTWVDRETQEVLAMYVTHVVDGAVQSSRYLLACS